MSIALIALLVLGKAAFAFDQRSIRHAIEHAQELVIETASHHHAPAYDDDADEGFSEMKHHLLHATWNFQAAVWEMAVASQFVPAYRARIIPFASVAPRHRSIEPPLRPPRERA